MGIFNKIDNSLTVDTFKQFLEGTGLKILLSNILQAGTIQQNVLDC